MSQGIEAIIFDLGNVVVDFDHLIAAKRIAQFCDKTPQEIFSLFFSSPATLLFEEGKISPEEFFRQVKEMLGLRLSFESFINIWNEIFFLTPKNRAVYSLANRLRMRYKTALLSNINILHYEYLKKNFPVFGVFNTVVASCEVGAVKPDQKIYQKVLELLKTKPENAFYTDDRSDLISSAKELGIKSFVFNGLDQLKGDLEASGVSIE